MTKERKQTTSDKQALTKTVTGLLLGKLLPGSWMLALQAGQAVSHHFLNKRQADRQKAIEGLQNGFDGLDPMLFGKGAGRLIGKWIRSAEPDFEAQVVLAKQLSDALDLTSETHYEMAIHRYVISKIFLELEGYTSKHKTSPQGPQYQIYQHQAKTLLTVLPQYKHLERRDVFLGIPFSGELLLIASHRTLTALSLLLYPDKPQALGRYLAKTLQHYLDKQPVKDAADYYALLVALTYRQRNPDVLSNLLVQWFEDYRQFLKDKK